MKYNNPIDNKYVNDNKKTEEKYKKVTLTLRIVGITLIVIGLSLSIAGFTSFFIGFNNNEMPSYHFLSFIGMPILFIGIVCTIFGFVRSLQKFAKQSSLPIMKEIYHQARHEIKSTRAADQFKNPNDPFAKTFNEVPTDSVDTSTDEIEYCPNCGAKIMNNAKFCHKCGQKITK